MFIEINLDPSIIEIINSKSFSNAIIIASSANLENKILLYADMRVAPSGIVNLKDRLDEVHLRHPKYVNNPDFSTLATAVEKIEQEISSKVDLPLSSINELLFQESPYNSYLISLVVGSV